MNRDGLATGFGNDLDGEVIWQRKSLEREPRGWKWLSH